MARSMGRTDGHVITNGIVIVISCSAVHRRLPTRASALSGPSYLFLLHGLF
jgi:hypothetical protein